MKHSELTQKEMIGLIRANKITFAGNARMKIFGKLNCSSGKRMNKENRVFFKNETEALEYGFRPCGHCMHDRYLAWKRST
ncbi:MAG TPA: Ada metal-binding domain-containing protein [Cyclobacteriaceae bacterium]|nr:Ada metal-binding domain-containing protein [Cyclobacteriaceae bacterium]